MAIPFLYQLQNASYASLDQSDFRIAVVDQDDSNLSAAQVGALRAEGKMVLAYNSIGEAENYRDYWSAGKWSTSPPSFLLGENPDWEGNYLVKFWDTAWQNVVLQRVDAALALGYNGIYLDIVDAYTVSQVQRAYGGSAEQLRQEMIDFVIRISEYAKAKNPDFMVVPQNAVGLLATDENNPDSASNMPYLNAIDGLGVEDLWYDGNSTSSWTAGDLEYLVHAVAANKFVLATSYPTDPAKQATFITRAIDAGLIPFATDRDLTGQIPAANNNTEKLMAGVDITFPVATGGGTDGGTGGTDGGTGGTDGGTGGTDGGTGGTDGGTGGTDGGTGGTDGGTGGTDGGTGGTDGGTGTAPVIRGDAQSNALTGTAVAEAFLAGAGDDTVKGGAGDDTLSGEAGKDKLLGNAGNDSLSGGLGNDLLSGQADADTLSGGEGRDRIDGGRGNDVLYGGADQDVFHFYAGGGQDVVRDFQDDIDTIKLHGAALANPFGFAAEKSGDVVFTFAGGDILVVENATIAELRDDLLVV